MVVVPNHNRTGGESGLRLIRTSRKREGSANEELLRSRSPEQRISAPVRSAPASNIARLKRNSDSKVARLKSTSPRKIAVEKSAADRVAPDKSTLSKNSVPTARIAPL